MLVTRAVVKISSKVNMNDTPLPPGQPVQQMSDLVRDIARALVDDPDGVQVKNETIEGETILRLLVSEEDLGKLIGKQGRTARSLRAIVGAASSKLRLRCTVDIRSYE